MNGKLLETLEQIGIILSDGKVERNHNEFYFTNAHVPWLKPDVTLILAERTLLGKTVLDLIFRESNKADTIIELTHAHYYKEIDKLINDIYLCDRAEENRRFYNHLRNNEETAAKFFIEKRK